jgi:dTDP-glucose 4,6-dehydratase
METSPTILVTGGTGAIGVLLIHYLLRKTTSKIVNVDLMTYCANHKPNLFPKDRYKLYRLDLCNFDSVLKVFQKEKPYYVFHLAAETHVDNSFVDAFSFTMTNTVGTHVLLEAMRMSQCVKRFIHMSTDEVYGSVDVPAKETDPLKPSNPYSASKAAAEMLVEAYVKSFKLPVIIVRCNNAISPWQYPEKLIPKTIKLIMNNQKVPIQGTGQSRRTFIDASDIARALWVCATIGKDGEIYNIGSDNEHSVLDVVKEIVGEIYGNKDVDLKMFIDFVEDRPYQDSRYLVNWEKIKALGWIPQKSFKEAIASCIDSYFIEHELRRSLPKTA